MSIKEIENVDMDWEYPFGPNGPFVWVWGEEVVLDGSFTLPMLKQVVAQMEQSNVT